jgi:hypothetical protein
MMHCNKMTLALYVLAMFVCSISMSPIGSGSEANSPSARNENRDALEALLASYRQQYNGNNLEVTSAEEDDNNNDEDSDDESAALVGEYEDSDLVHYMSKKAAPRRIFIGKRAYNGLDDLAEYQKRSRQNRYLNGKRNGQIHRIFIGKRGDIKRIFIG